MIEWTLRKGVSSDFNGKEGFIYELTYDDGCKYIGKKLFASIRKKKLGKKELAEQTDKRLKKYKVITSESDWKTYEGSLKDKGNRKLVSKEIIKTCVTRQDLSYWENYFLFGNEVLFNTNYLNKNIAGSFYAGKITGSKEW